MRDERKTKNELIKELAQLRRRIAKLEKSDAERKRAEQLVQDARAYAESIVATVREPLLVLDADLKVISVSRSFYQTFKVTPEETEGHNIYDLGNRQWDIPKLRELLENVPSKNTFFDDYEMEHDFETLGQKTMLLNARRIYRETNKTRLILLAIEDITERKRAEQDIKKYASQLEEANKELEAFAYSVSHDLRAPLRGIDGFSRALLENYHDKLNDRGKDYIHRVTGATRRMGRLIDDLLKLSRITRSEMKRESVDISQLARSIATDIKKEQPERQADFIIAEGLIVNGDARLLQVAMENLLGNAWKFTGKIQTASIEFGITEHEGEKAYFVRDNGVGFNMAYADKLFGAFQRLHSTHEFPGTGIGLATVARIIRRHGGRVWAKGEVGKGATFYFTL